MAAKKKDPVSFVTFLRNTYRLEHDGDNYIIRIHCSARGRPDYEGTFREWMPTPMAGRTLGTIREQFMRTLQPPYGAITVEALDEVLSGADLLIPESLTRRKPVVSETPAA